MVETMYFISEAAKEVKVENHVLRYWEEELNLPVKRNEQGHRYYTKEDIERFIYIKQLKEEGLQLKAIRNLLEKQGVVEEKTIDPVVKKNVSPQLMILNSNKLKPKRTFDVVDEDKQEKAYRLQMLLKAMIAEAVSENNRELGNDIKEIVQKEMDYQFRMQEEREEEREKQRVERENAHYTRIDELLREKLPNKRKKHSLW
ncbi:MAG: MerR family transcriptional regulator [Lachnospiraceae bacterium]|nr:MerR family transcriptional regulator [Lachnospiraceae bacterium]MBO5325342.1 MerR family transcriptional regulator [Lachnospiraceae bacterium]